jgi:antitoxin component YwqK of YwqJK toxin-antitoxin module
MYACNRVANEKQSDIIIKRTYHPNGKIESVTSYVDSTKQGYFAFFDEYGVIRSDGILIDGKLNGTFIFYVAGQKFIEDNYINDTMNGEKIFYYMNGNIRQKGMMINGKVEGKYEYYTENGEIAKIKNYKNDTIVNEIVYIADFDEDNWFDFDGPM